MTRTGIALVTSFAGSPSRADRDQLGHRANRQAQRLLKFDYAVLT